jgi:cytochrome b pre-mRNA-processing protein 3
MFGLFGDKNLEGATHRIYTSIVEQSRQPGFYLNCGVSDTPDGRFDLIVIHAFLVLRLLKNETGNSTDLAQSIFDLMFADMDQNLREMGAGDMGVGKKIKAMAEAFYGRVKAYEDGLTGEASLEDALQRNLYRKTNPDQVQIKAMAGYMQLEARQLGEMAEKKLLVGNLTFGPAPDL